MNTYNLDQNVIDALDLNIALLDLDGTIVSFNKQWETFAKKNGNETLKNSDIGANYLEAVKKSIIDGDETARDAYNGIMDVIWSKRERFDLEYPCHSPDEKRWFIMHARKCIDQDLVVIYHENITDRKIAEEKLKASEEKYRKLAESAHAVLWEYNILEDRWTYVSPQVTEMLGYSPEEWTDIYFWEDHIHPDDQKWAVQYCNESTQRGESHTFEYRFLKKDGNVAWIRDVVSVDMKDNIPVKLRGFMIDITERKRLEELKKKELLLKEVHHRVKNNLQVISSLLNLQSRNFSDENVKAAFTDSQNRVKSMSLAHEKLYQSSDLSTIEMSDYIKNLAGYLYQVYKINKDINLIIEADSEYFNVDTAVPLGLILNELITNSLKHAFVNGKGGQILIKFINNNGKYVLEVSDDGTGFNQDIESHRSLGLKIVHMLADQLNATVSIDASKGTRTVINF